ncbi:MAG: mycothiol biosynthesis protein [Microbacteriaceae bacterium]|nr:mycothiol biosynthesis protein [Microbacteriaceae bacterium]
MKQSPSSAPDVGHLEGIPERVLFVHAHPDDETIATGGTLAVLVDRGAEVTVLTCTRGEQGEVIPDSLQYLLQDTAALAAYRELELSAAMAALGVDDHRFLGAADARMVDRPPRRYTDSGMVWGASGPEPLSTLTDDALCSAEFGEVVADIATVIATTQANAVVSYNENGGYGHPDHVLVHLASRRAAEAMRVPFFVIEPLSPAGSGAITVDVVRVLDRKKAALRAHATQLTLDGDTVTMSGGQVDTVGIVERFRRADSAVPARTFRDHSIPSRVLITLVTLVLGALIGALGTVAHGVVLTVGAVDIPTGLIVGLIVVATVLAGLRIVLDSRVPAVAAAVGIIAVVNLLSTRSTGGSVLIPDTDIAYFWVYGPVAIGFVVLAWPKLPQRSRDRIVGLSDPKGIPAP